MIFENDLRNKKIPHSSFLLSEIYWVGSRMGFIKIQLQFKGKMFTLPAKCLHVWGSFIRSSFILKVNQKGLISFAALHKKFENFDVISKSNSKLNSAVEQNGLI